MTNAYNLLFTFISTLINACINLANATENITQVADDASANYLKAQQIQAKQTNLKLEAELSAMTEELSSTTTAI